MAYDFKHFEKRIKEVSEKATRELAGIRTGRAAPAVLDGIMVESYGTRVPIVQVAAVAVEDARTIRITPWDMSNAKEIEKAIMQANLGLSVGTDERGVRVNFPELTSDRRAQLIKVAKEKIEEIRTSLRSARDEVWSDIQKKERDGLMPEDDKFRAKDEMQKRVDAANKSFDAALERKEKEIHS
jgi:ribosome recycling factor